MTEHTLTEQGGDPAALTPGALADLQWSQFQHDEAFHREIARLNVQDRLKHMALHFAKYAGSLADAPEESEVKRLVTDVIVIALSSANILNVRLSDHHNKLKRSVSEGGLVREISISAGRMAAACEKMDHLEPFPFREKITAAVLELFAISTNYASDRGWDIPRMIKDRLQPVKEKSIFYGRI